MLRSWWLGVKMGFFAWRAETRNPAMCGGNLRVEYGPSHTEIPQYYISSGARNPDPAAKQGTTFT